MKDVIFKIHKLGPVENVEIKFAPMVILTGESSLGKSYVNYLFYYFTSFFYNLQNYKLLVQPIDLSKGTQTFFIKKSLLEDTLHNGLEDFMRNFLGDDTFKCDVEFLLPSVLEEMKFSYSIKASDLEMENDKELLFSFSGGMKINFKLGNIDERHILACLRLSFVNYLFDGNLHSPIILPPGRGAFVGENFSVKNSISSSMGMYNDFFSQYDSATLPSANSKKLDDAFLRMMQDLIGGQLITDKNKQYFVMEDGKQISLNAAASSIKEISPFLFYLKNKFDRMCFVCFEEPEAHLHPSMQITLADLVAAYHNKGASFQITTHSDYFLARINQLIKLNELGNKKDSIAEKIGTSPISALDKSNIAAYFFYRDEEKNVKVKQLSVTKHGIPFATFFDVINKQQDENDLLDDMLENI